MIWTGFPPLSSWVFSWDHPTSPLHPDQATSPLGQFMLTVRHLPAPTDPNQTQSPIPACSNSWVPWSSLSPPLVLPGWSYEANSPQSFACWSWDLQWHPCHSHGLTLLHEDRYQTCWARPKGTDSQTFQHLYSAIMKNRWDQVPSETTTTHTTCESSLENKHIQVLVCILGCRAPSSFNLLFSKGWQKTSHPLSDAQWDLGSYPHLTGQLNEHILTATCSLLCFIVSIAQISKWTRS